MPEPAKSITVLLADDHLLVRAGLRSLMQGLAGIEVVGEAGDGLAALELIKKLRPQVVLMDISMKGLNGLEATKRALKVHRTLKVIMLSVHGEEEYVTSSLAAGARGYLVKHAAPEELGIAINAVCRGEIYLCPGIAKQVLDKALQWIKGGKSPALLRRRSERLTGRQVEILQLIAEGQTTKEIAARLKLSVKTVNAHRYQLMKQLDVHETAGLVRYAIRRGLITP